MVKRITGKKDRDVPNITKITFMETPLSQKWQWIFAESVHKLSQKCAKASKDLRQFQAVSVEL